MCLLRRFTTVCASGAMLAAACIAPCSAAALRALHRFSDTGQGTPSHYGLGSGPQSELLQASDGNFYGTTVNGGTGVCPDPFGSGAIIGCGTIFRMTPQGTVSALYSFPYDTATGTAPNGAYPTAGLIQAKDGALYGVARGGGGLGECNEPLGCGTLFRISLTGSFTLLHRFCSGDGCANPTEGGQPAAHLVRLASGALCGTTAEGGRENEGTVFCASTRGTVTTRYVFEYENGTDGYNPVAPLLVGTDGETLYGTTALGGVNGGPSGGGTVFALKASRMIILHAFDDYESSTPGTYYNPKGALIFGADGRLYGTTETGGSGGGCIFALNTDGTGFAVQHDFGANAASNSPGFPVAGLVLARDGMMYGTASFGDLEGASGPDSGIVFRFDPARGAYKGLADFTGSTGSPPIAALIEGSDDTLYTTASFYGGGNARGPDHGSVVRVVPALSH